VSLLLLLPKSSFAWYSRDIGRFDTLPGQNYAVIVDDSFTFSVNFEESSVNECLTACATSADCLAVIALVQESTCYFRGGRSLTPSGLIAQKIESPESELYVIYSGNEPRILLSAMFGAAVVIAVVVRLCWRYASSADDWESDGSSTKAVIFDAPPPDPHGAQQEDKGWYDMFCGVRNTPQDSYSLSDMLCGNRSKPPEATLL